MFGKSCESDEVSSTRNATFRFNSSGKFVVESFDFMTCIRAMAESLIFAAD
jgi:hypothetical protein